MALSIMPKEFSLIFFFILNFILHLNYYIFLGLLHSSFKLLYFFRLINPIGYMVMYNFQFKNVFISRFEFSIHNIFYVGLIRTRFCSGLIGSFVNGG